MAATPVYEVLSVPRRDPNPIDVGTAMAEIVQHKVVIAALEEQVKNHRDKLTACREVATFARRLPPELLLIIFEICIENEWHHAPLVLSQVCTAWHAAASTPKLWSQIHISGEGDEITPETCTRYWLTKAGDTPLHITITWHANYGFQEHMSTVIDMLFSRVAQWSSLTLHMWDKDRNAFLASCASRIPNNLRYLDTGREPSKHASVEVLTPLQVVFGAHNTPALTTIKHVCTTLPAAPMFPSHIQTLVLGISCRLPLSTKDYMPFLSNLPQLRSLFLSYRGFVHKSSDPTKRVSLPNLDTLSIYGDAGFDLLRYLDVPSLRVLQLHPASRFTFDLDDLLALLVACSPPLERLKLYCCCFDPAMMLQCFPRLKGLRRLRIHYSTQCDEMLGLLVRYPEFCPRLTRVSVHTVRAGDKFELVKSRDEIGPSAVGKRFAGILENWPEWIDQVVIEDV